MRKASIERNTKETQIKIELNLDGSGNADISTGVGFFDHMLTLFAFHGQLDLKIQATGDLEVCDHHLVEDTGIALGMAFLKCLEDKKGIRRYGNAFVPMDESLACVNLDISGRSFLVYHMDYVRETIGNFSLEMVEEFLRAFSNESRTTLHARVLYGKNDHHKVEALFKAFGRAVKEAKTIDGDTLPSTKGVL